MIYPIVIIPISEAEGGGYMAHVPDLKGCMSDGDTPEMAAANVGEAIGAWIDESTRLGRDIPEAGSSIARAKKERDILYGEIDRLQEVLKSYDDLDERIEDLRCTLNHIADLLDDDFAVQRFTAISGIGIQQTLKFRTVIE